MKDPFFKPVLLGGLIIALLTVFFALGIFIWAFIGGWYAIKFTILSIKKRISILDSIVVGLCTGVFGSLLIDLLTVISFSAPDNRKVLLDILRKNWPPNSTIPSNLSEILPDVLIVTAVLIVVISVFFAILGSVFSRSFYSKKKL